MIRVWRTTKRKYVDSAFAGEGARLAGGRFNPPGTPLVYTSGTLSLSVLEVLTQVVGYEDLEGYVALSASFDDHLVKVLDEGDLPVDWRALPAPESTRPLGMAWIASQETPILRVPSLVLPAEHNFLINPAHPDSTRIEIGEVLELEFEPRLLRL